MPWAPHWGLATLAVWPSGVCELVLETLQSMFSEVSSASQSHQKARQRGRLSPLRAAKAGRASNRAAVDRAAKDGTWNIAVAV